MKAILVIDMPKDMFVDDCKIEYCVVENVTDMCVEDGIKKLKPLPKKKEIEWSDSFGKHNYKKGFNACIDEITGEE